MDNERLIYALKQHAYIIGQAAELNAIISGMNAENQIAISKGFTPPYNEGDYYQVLSEHTVSHNDVIELFNY